MPGRADYPAVSPNGQQIVFQLSALTASNVDLWVVDRAAYTAAG